MRVSVFFAWYDFWVGAFYDRSQRALYICLLPCCVIAIQAHAHVHVPSLERIKQHHAALRDIMYYEPTRIAPIIYVRLRR